MPGVSLVIIQALLAPALAERLHPQVTHVELGTFRKKRNVATLSTFYPFPSNATLATSHFNLENTGQKLNKKIHLVSKEMYILVIRQEKLFKSLNKKEIVRWLFFFASRLNGCLFLFINLLIKKSLMI